MGGFVRWRPVANRLCIFVHARTSTANLSLLSPSLGLTSYILIGYIVYVKRSRIEFVQGTLDMLILRTLAHGPLHGYGIAQAIGRTTDSAIQVEAGSLYPALQRLELRGLLTGTWEVSGGGRRTRIYRLTPSGEKRLEAEVSRWE